MTYRDLTIDDIKARCIVDDDSECWTWNNCLHKNGYGRIRTKGKTHFVHRLAYTIAKGYIRDGNDVYNTCNNRACCNPEHLKQGNRSATMAKVKRNGRTSSGLQHSMKMTAHRRRNAKLTLQKAREIRQLYAEGSPIETIASNYGVCESTVQKIIAGTSWIDHYPLSAT